MRDMGAVLTTTESVLLELMGTADHPLFKELSPMLRAHNDDVKSVDILSNTSTL